MELDKFYPFRLMRRSAGFEAEAQGWRGRRLSQPAPLPVMLAVSYPCSPQPCTVLGAFAKPDYLLAQRSR